MAYRGTTVIQMRREVQLLNIQTSCDDSENLPVGWDLWSSGQHDV